MQERYVNPFTDFGFKKIFGEEVNKDLLIDFLNELLHGQEVIQDLTYLKNEHLPNSPIDRKAIFDLYCENEKGEKFIVELQKVKQEHFKDRSLYYSTFAIQEQAVVGEHWNFYLQAVYTISIMDFTFERSVPEPSDFRHHIQLMDTRKLKVFYDKLTFVYLEMPKFSKTLTELENHFDHWMYVLKNLHRLQERPVSLQEKVFEKLFLVAEIANFNPDEREVYKESVKTYRDLKNSIDTSHAEGLEKGREEGKKERETEIIRTLLQTTSLTLEQIAQSCSVSVDYVKQLQNTL